MTGLSPRVRGNHNRRPARHAIVRSIPACAGEPGRTALRIQSPRVYPRVCGGTSFEQLAKESEEGLSPRVRGNLSSARSSTSPSGSIPACAGEPDSPSECVCMGWVYPRVCGGTLAGWAMASPVTGLSPRVRGNRLSQLETYEVERSIPACAGEPKECFAEAQATAVYPRVCGGTF